MININDNTKPIETHQVNMTYNMPKDGCFCAIWVHNEQLWSETYKWDNGELLQSGGDGIFRPRSHDNTDEYAIERESIEATYFILTGKDNQ